MVEHESKTVLYNTTSLTYKAPKFLTIPSLLPLGRVYSGFYLFKKSAMILKAYLVFRYSER